MNDKKIIHDLKLHRQKALIEIMNLYGGYTYTIAKNILNGIMSQEDIDEVVSDIFFKVWDNADKLDDNKPLKPYLVSIARNEARNKLRQFRGDMSLDQDEYEKLENNITAGPDYNIEMKEQFELISQVLDESSNLDREIFVRYYYNYEKTKEIAKVCDVSLSKVKMTLSRMRKKMEKILEENGYGR